MATDASELETPVLSEENSEMLTEKTEKEKQQDPEAVKDEAGDSWVDAPLKIAEAVAECVQDGEVGDAKPAAEEEAVAVGAVAAAEAVVVVTVATTVAAATRDANDDVVVGCQLAKSEEDGLGPEDDVDTSDNVFDDTVNEIEIKPEEPREERQLPVIVSCVKGKATSEDAPESAEEKTNTGGGELAVGDKRRASVEMSSSDGEPLSRMDSEDRLVLLRCLDKHRQMFRQTSAYVLISHSARTLIILSECATTNNIRKVFLRICWRIHDPVHCIQCPLSHVTSCAKEMYLEIICEAK